MLHHGKLYAGGIREGTTEADLSEHFSKFGEVAAVAIPLHKRSAKPRGFGFVQFVKREDAERALAAGREPGGHVVRGTRLHVKVATPISGGVQPSDEDQDLSPIKRKIFVGGFPKSLDGADLRNYFRQFGDVTRASVVISKFTNRSRGFGFVKFASEEAAQRVLEKRRHYLGGLWAEVKDAMPPRYWSGGLGSSGHHRMAEAASSGVCLSASAPPYHPGGWCSGAVVVGYFQPWYFVHNDIHAIAATGGAVVPEFRFWTEAANLQIV